MSEKAESPPPIGAASVVTQDVVCAGCGYNLRTLALDAICPECGRLVQSSLGLPAPEWGDPAWLSRVMLGCWVIVAGQVVLVTAVAASVIEMAQSTPPWIGGSLLGMSLLMDGVGAMLMVAPVRDEDQTLTTARIWVRSTAMLPLLGLLVMLLQIRLAAVPPESLGLSLLAASWAICIWSTFAYLARLARRARLVKISGAARWCSIGLSVATGVCIAAQLGHGPLFACCALPGVLLMIVLWLVAIWSLVRMAGALAVFKRAVSTGRVCPNFRERNEPRA